MITDRMATYIYSKPPSCAALLYDEYYSFSLFKELISIMFPTRVFHASRGRGQVTTWVMKHVHFHNQIEIFFV